MTLSIEKNLFQTIHSKMLLRRKCTYHLYRLLMHITWQSICYSRLSELFYLTSIGSPSEHRMGPLQRGIMQVLITIYEFQDLKGTGVRISQF